MGKWLLGKTEWPSGKTGNYKIGGRKCLKRFS